MKKLFAILLVIVMVVPLCFTAQAAEVEKKPFYLVNWGPLVDADESVTKDFTNTYYMPYIWFDSSKMKKGTVYAYASKTGGSGTGVAGAKVIAERTKEWWEENNIPEGARYINFTLPATSIKAMNDLCFVGKATPVISEWIDAFCKELKALGGELDGVTVDVEFLGIYSNYIHGGGDGVDFSYAKDPLIYKKIVENPEYTEKVRPMLVERGFKFYSPVSDNTPEVFSIHPNSGSEYAQSRSIWNAVMRTYLANEVTEGCSPMWDYFPDAVLSDYQTKNADPWVKELDDSGSVQTGSGGSYVRVGNSSNDNFYCVRPKTTFFKDSNGATAYPTMPGYNNAVFSNTPYNKFLFDMNTAKNTYLTADADKNGTKQVSWWLGHAYYGSASHNAYWAERIMHLCMLNPQIFLGYILQQDCRTDGQNDVEKYTNALLITDQVLSMASDMAGYADMKPLNVEHNWNYGFVLSGAYANGRNVYRITPDTTNMSLADFQVKDAKDPTFSINGTTVTFPGGKIIADKEVYDIGTCGYWVETAANVTPVVTRGADYYREYAAYQETFEQYDVGMEYVYKNVTPEYTWEMKKTGAASSKIVADPTGASGKMLAVTGNYEYKNVKMPDNIIGADTYAKHQAWEMSFILPDDMPADAELNLLYAVHSKNKFKDNGIQIKGGKVYYDNAGTLTELAGVTLTAGAKYTVVREFDFTNAEACTCSYYVYDANRNLLGKAVKIGVPAKWEIPIVSIQYSVKGVTGNPVLFDNYRLYTTKVNSDFYLYDAATGIPATDVNAPREKATAYRFAWLNSTNTEKSYTVMIAYYEGETKVSEKAYKELTLPANTNGVDFGEIVNDQAGKSMVVYIRDNNPPEDETDLDSGKTDTDIISPEGTEVLDRPVDITVGDADIELWQEPGADAAQVGTAQSGQQLTVTETITIDGVKWGKVEGGWIKLEKTNYDVVVKAKKDEKTFLEENLMIIIIAGAAVVVAVVVVIVIVSSKKKKKKAPAAEEPATEEKTEE